MTSRRDFLSQSAVLGIGAALSSSWLERAVRWDALARLDAERLPAAAAHRAGELSLGNAAINGVWSVAGGRLTAVRAEDRVHQRPLALPAAVFTLTMADGRTVAADAMRVIGEPAIERIGAEPGASRYAERVGGRRITVTLRDDAANLDVTWRAVLRDGSRYLRQELTLAARGGDAPVREISLVDLRTAGAEVTGTVKGSPVAFGAWYAGFEHPLSLSTVDGDRVTCVLPRVLPVRAGAPVTVSSVLGVVRAGQRRRDFLEYVERERAHPYRTFLHYNSWYDIGYFNKYTQADALDVIDAFGRELHQRRGVVLSSYLFDDGWDDPRTLWGFGPGFPDGFTPLRVEAAKYGAAPGVWLSPWGGYGQPQKDRLTYGEAQGFETNKGGFALSGPKYYQRFHDTCVKFIREYGVNQFKIDGTGNASTVIPGSRFDSDFDAAIALIDDLRRVKPDLYVNLTTGTYPSPFWLRYADSIWRGGEDHSFAGVGTWRQQWMTYRDADTHRHVVQRGALYPLNSLMLHGLIYAKRANHLMDDPGHDFNDEIRVYFGNGTQLQEMYVTPANLTPDNWDTLAESASWSRRNANTLRDTHWVGGDPAQLEPYGWAAWAPEKATLTLRNPSAEWKTIALDPQQAFELPNGAVTRFTARSPWKADAGQPAIGLEAGREHAFRLAPFQVLNLDVVPNTGR
ncbi:MAG: twin-arginine translocation signal domain-containing protein [Gemmatimonadota bacterium]|nr:twin-arginine translocation signal domain-containing protein [Gemmatimonadota bacterium]